MVAPMFLSQDRSPPPPSLPKTPSQTENLTYVRFLQAVQKLVDEEFEGIVHLRTSSLHKKIANARHDFIKLSGSENKLEALLQVFYFCWVFNILF